MHLDLTISPLEDDKDLSVLFSTLMSVPRTACLVHCGLPNKYLLNECIFPSVLESEQGVHI